MSRHTNKYPDVRSLIVEETTQAKMVTAVSCYCGNPLIWLSETL